MAQGFIDAQFRRSAVRLRIRGCFALSNKFITSQGSEHIRPVSVLYFTCLKMSKILLSLNLIHPVTVSYHQECQQSQFQPLLSLLLSTFYARETIDSRGA